MEAKRFETVLVSMAQSGTRREALRRLATGALGLGGLTLLGVPATARRRKKRKGGKGGKGGGGGGGNGGGGGGGGGGTLGIFEICDPDANACLAGLRCDSPTTRHTCSSTVDGIDFWCCVPEGGSCTECECCGDFYCDFGDANPDGACRPNPEG